MYFPWPLFFYKSFPPLLQCVKGREGGREAVRKQLSPATTVTPWSPGPGLRSLFYTKITGKSLLSRALVLSDNINRTSPEICQILVFDPSFLCENNLSHRGVLLLPSLTITQPTSLMQRPPSREIGRPDFLFHSNIGFFCLIHVLEEKILFSSSSPPHALPWRRNSLSTVREEETVQKRDKKK